MREHNFLRWHWFVVLLVLGAGFEIGLAAEPEKLPVTIDEGLVLVQGGSFQMGDVWGDSPWAMREVPVHEVQVDDFLLARHEVTVAEFKRFVTATGYKTIAERTAGSEANRGFLKTRRAPIGEERARWVRSAPMPWGFTT